MTRIFVTRRLPAICNELLASHFVVEANEDSQPLSTESLHDVLAAYDGVLTSVSDKVTAACMEGARVRAISNYGVGLDNIEVEAARARGIAVYHVPHVVTDSTADLTFALLLSLVRRIPPAQHFVRNGQWRCWDPGLFVGEELAGKTLGILGYGRIGRAVARRAQGFGMRVIAQDEAPAPDEALVLLDVLLRESDVISIHLPLTPATRGMVNLEMMRRMHRRPILLNLARGPIVKTDDLVCALREGLVRGAALDVTDPEPIGGDHPLVQMENCLVVPHIGTSTEECRGAMARHAARNLIEHFGRDRGLVRA